MPHELTIEVSDDDWPLLIRKLANPARNREGLDLTAWTAAYLHRCADTQRESEAFDAAKAAGRLYKAKFWRHYNEYEEEFFTPQEAAGFLENGEEYGDLSSRGGGVFDPDGNDMGWRYVDGWTKGEPQSQTAVTNR